MHDLHQIEQSVWAELIRAVGQADHDWRLPVLGTGSADRWDMRTVVLRAVDLDSRTLTCHSDARAAKVVAIRRDARVRWLFYDRTRQTQLKIEANASVHTADAIADQQWLTTPLSSRRAYLAPDPPGQHVDTASVNLPPEYCERLPTELEVAAGRDNFSAIVTRVIRVEWLRLFRTGNLRAVFHYEGDRTTATWITP